eukprot:TRINITY_DN11209_c0_g1_i1.p1 TRINITY_DN11209_c0_g1~~TRINITY_DN11209_c0_g1_i1.p1  ORF type:complete len:376 (+),score=89.64 TRINITY_DN11209_c0_g1_i1:135-1262(+)
MSTCSSINRDLTNGVDGLASSVLDWLSRATSSQDSRVLTRISARPRDYRGQTHQADLYWHPAYTRIEATTGRMVTAPVLGRLQCKGCLWSGSRNQGWWTSFLFARPKSAGCVRVTNSCRSFTFFGKRNSSSRVPVDVRTGFGVSLYRQAAPNVHGGVTLGFPRSLTASLCADVFRRWTATISYSYNSLLVASARFAANLATKADSLFEVGFLCRLHPLWDALSDGSTAHFSWTKDGVALGTSLVFDGVDKAERAKGGMQICVSFSTLFPIGQPLGRVQASKSEEPADAAAGRARLAPPRLFVGLELRPWLGSTDEGDLVLNEDPLCSLQAPSAPPPPPPPALSEDPQGRNAPPPVGPSGLPPPQPQRPPPLPPVA